jgi:hypothetical protein
MVTENHVNIDLAKLLKYKGFNEATEYIFYYYEEDDDYCFERLLPEDKFIEDKMIRCPSLQMTLKWLREEHHIFVQIELYDKYEDYVYEIFQNTHRLMIENRQCFSTPEEAAESAIEYCLENLI